jgi:hypothetical protein
MGTTPEKQFIKAMEEYSRWKLQDRTPKGDERMDFLYAKCLGLASEVPTNVDDRYGLLISAIAQTLPDDVCLALIAKNYKTSMHVFLSRPKISRALVDAILASHPHFYAAGRIVMHSYELKLLFFTEGDIFDIFAKWGRVTTPTTSTRTLLEEVIDLRRKHLRNPGAFHLGSYREPGTPVSFPRLRLLRLLPDYDNFVNVIVNWRRGSRVGIGGIERMIWRYLVGDLKF